MSSLKVGRTRRGEGKPEHLSQAAYSGDGCGDVERTDGPPVGRAGGGSERGGAARSPRCRTAYAAGQVAAAADPVLPGRPDPGGIGQPTGMEQEHAQAAVGGGTGCFGPSPEGARPRLVGSLLR